MRRRCAPFSAKLSKASKLCPESKPPANPAEAPSAERYGVSPDYLRSMGIPLLRGRGFTEQDSANAPFVTLVNRTAAGALWPNEDPRSASASGWAILKVRFVL